MLLRPTLPLSLLLLIASSPVSALAESTSVKSSLIPRAVHNLHSTAVKHTKSFARDLRVVFGALLVASPDDQTSQHVIYCKPQRKSGGSVPTTGATSNGNGTSSASAGSSTRGGSTSKPTGTGSTSKGPSATGVPASPWKLTQSSQGDTFFDDWTWFTAPDPTNGIVQYVDQKTAYGNNLASINNAGNAIMRVETTPKVSGNRMSVRITTNYQFNGGLIVMDAVHMPTGCGVWPAWWTNGPNWPTGGEIDIVEGVGDYTNNQATIHTDPGCTLSSADANTLKISGSVIGGTDCAALTTGNQGCGIRAGSSNSFGAAFNKNGGGTYAMKWDSSGIAVYFFPRGSEPADLEANAPNPDRWGNPQARWPASGCDPFKYFNNHHGIFDTTLCGDWAGGVWNSAGIPGQEQSCAQRTGFSTCEDFVRNNGGSMQEAYWEVRSVKLFQTD